MHGYTNCIIDNWCHIFQGKFETASTALFHATHDKFYFKEITILAPSNWTEIHNTITTWSCEDAHFIVDSANPLYGDTPYTKSSGKCGKSGEHIHFTPDYIHTNYMNSTLADEIWGPISKFLKCTRPL